MLKRYYSTAQAAKLLNVSRTLMTKMASDGRVKAIRVGNHYRIPHEELERLQQPVKPNAKQCGL
jgi:excisionase family DNA binding protein